jgi:hypothetical protein
LEIREAIAEYAEGHSLKKTRDWIAKKHKVKTSQTAVGNFLSWFKVIRQRQLNYGALEALSERLEAEHPDWTPEQIQEKARAYFAGYTVEQNNIEAWSDAEALAFKCDRLKLDRDKFERTHIETIARICNNPRVREIAKDNKKSYTERLTEIRTIMFGDQ